MIKDAARSRSRHHSPHHIQTIPGPLHPSYLNYPFPNYYPPAGLPPAPNPPAPNHPPPVNNTVICNTAHFKYHISPQLSCSIQYCIIIPLIGIREITYHYLYLKSFKSSTIFNKCHARDTIWVYRHIDAFVSRYSDILYDTVKCELA